MNAGLRSEKVRTEFSTDVKNTFHEFLDNDIYRKILIEKIKSWSE